MFPCVYHTEKHNHINYYVLYIHIFYLYKQTSNLMNQEGYYPGQ